MCLTVSTFYHKRDKNGDIKSFVAKEDILVYKFLRCDECGYHTPFQFMPVNFTKGKFEYERVPMPLKLISYYPCVYIGIHTYSAKRATFNVKNPKFLYSRQKKRESMHYAIIPKGSNFYIGIDEDVVSDNLIVYRQKRCFDKHYPNIINAVEYIHKYIKNK